MPQEFSEETVGTRMARIRKLRHTTQAGLAAAAQVSLAHVSMIEQGRRQASPTVLAAIARALSVPVTDLTGQPYLEQLRRDQLDSLVQPLREALDLFDLGADPDVRPRPLAELDAHAERVCRLIRATDLRAAAAELPAVITEATTAAHSTGERRAWQVLASSYRSAYDVASKLGFPDLATIALGRLGWAAEHASDAPLAAVGLYNRSLSALRAGQYKTGLRIAELAHRTADQADPGVTRDAVTGQVHLAAAVIAARAQDRDTVRDRIAEADRIAEGTGEVPDLLWLSFGPTNVRVHEASALIDQNLYGEALEVARGIRVPASWPASRAAHHHAEVARAQLWTGKAQAAFQSLLAARQLAAQQARHSFVVRETLTGVLRVQRSPSDAVTAYASWLGL
ncbi:transcriptional regulator with XRE-family HTH domain [Streptomyces sp. TLI_235]|nr:helix-turn-helix transcriptional regulator [Streptomyces sp. TLI_235]PBC77581.1 transcriptional regulator with XRE-family HTH domain [Streptomyces sp. TLI_235]